ncbi:hypothetical protein AUJ40_00555 [Candidatus Berkelbacteria bacterium CG1_02_42_45]|uniref:Uncharacterized protein n=1 Tax=Candidatus Berkelbacteria bacterium CG1_02_42_45 TaxID=1805036 RepID=A0A1J4RRU2_9BACT|nr:MAG: hypothetical protein AUJ40_00555 [Candidatus Berkelbacteria bacterium CG1_02_42_45]
MINSLEKLEIVKESGEVAQSFNFIQDKILEGWSSPPAVAKCVRTIFRILHCRIPIRAWRFLSTRVESISSRVVIIYLAMRLNVEVRLLSSAKFEEK